MSWIRRIFLKFTDNENEDDEIIIEKRHSENKNQIPKMNTRMTYQYPKGPFRFPLVEDPPKQHRDQTQKKLHNQERSNGSIRRRTSEFTSQPIERRKVEERRPKTIGKDYPDSVFKKKEPTPTRKIEPINKQPFRPTMVPSPIYGFNYPEKAKVEYEIEDSFLQNKLNDNEPQQDYEMNKMEVETLAPKESNQEEVMEEQKEKVTIELTNMEQQILTNDEIQEEHHISQKEEVITDKVITDIAPEQNVPTIKQEQDGEYKKTRKNMPFNVLMLKQDRKSLQKQQNKRQDPLKEEIIPQKEVSNHHFDKQLAETTTKEVAVTTELSEQDMDTYLFPPLQLLYPPVVKSQNKQWIAEQTELLDETLENFNVNAHVVNVSQGPSVTRFEVHPERGVKVNKITNLSDDIKLSLAAKDIRMEAPIPGKRTIGIELPNHESRPVQISEIIRDKTFLQNESPLTAALGLDISGEPVVTDLKKMPHGLIAGATGSGKSVCINSILVSLLYKAKPEDLKLLLIDPKMVELAPYNQIPHLVSPVITDVKAATAALKWAVEEMERRYELFAHSSVRDISRFNKLAEENCQYSDKLPYIVIVIDELAD